MSPPTRTTPSLRIAELAITNFRTFRERTVISFRDSEGGAADPVATFHGDNGSGKSNALAALDLFFRVFPQVFESTAEAIEVPWDRVYKLGATTVPMLLRYRDRPAGANGPTDLEVSPEDSTLPNLHLRIIPKGESALLLADASDTPRRHVSASRQLIAHWLTSPFGPGSRAFAVLNAARRPNWLTDPQKQPSDLLVEELFRFRTAKRPEIRDRWRQFIDLLGRFDAFRGKQISVDRTLEQDVPELFFEDPGKSVLTLPELSSGEQQIVTLLATILTANSAIVAMEEPELSLDAKNQALFKEILADSVKSGALDQMLLESHVPSFDGPRVIRFRKREDGTSDVERAHSAPALSGEIAAAARAHGAEERWVTADGYTQLPEIMRKDLALGAGKHVWFLRGGAHWEAWPEEEVQAYFAPPKEEKDEEAK